MLVTLYDGLKWTLRRIVVPALVVWFAIGVGGALVITAPSFSDFSGRTEFAGHKVEPVWITARDGARLSAWHIRNGNADRAAVLANGIYGNRMGAGGRAEIYLKRGYSVLMLDLRGTGQSEARAVTIGWNERLDLFAAHDYLHAQGYKQIGVHGISLGAAAAVYSCLEINDWAWVALESPYSTLDFAWRNRLALAHVPHFLTYSVRWCTELMMGVRAAELEPVRHIQHCTAPVFLICGDSESELRLEESQAIFAACPSPFKRMTVVKGGHHDNLLGQCPDQFVPAFQSFLSELESTWSATK